MGPKEICNAKQLWLPKKIYLALDALLNEDISQEDFEHYCLHPAMEMRGVIKKQLCIIDPKEFDVPGKRDIPEITYNP